jgi:hypothetical protein
VLRRSENWWSLIGGGKVKYAINEEGDSHFLQPSFMKRVIVTDKEEDILYRVFDPSDLKETVIDIARQSVIVEIHFPGQPRSMMAQLQIDSDADTLPPLQWIFEDENLMFQAIIMKHEQDRNEEILQHNPDIEREGDFITVYRDQGDSVSMQIKTQGRAAFSVDKGPRAMRSATLSDEDEVR